MLDLTSRGAIIALSALGVAGAIKLGPAPAEIPFAQRSWRPLPSIARSVADTVAPVVARRDPFAEPAPSPAATSAAMQAHVPAVGAIEPLPSNLAHDTIPALPGAPPDEPPATSDPRVTAIVTGAHPYAMLDSGGVHAIKGLGDRVGGIAILSIDLDGVRLSDGRRLIVDPAARP
jgi:hypothetical protein